MCFFQSCQIIVARYLVLIHRRAEIQLQGSKTGALHAYENTGRGQGGHCAGEERPEVIQCGRGFESLRPLQIEGFRPRCSRERPKSTGQLIVIVGDIGYLYVRSYNFFGCRNFRDMSHVKRAGSETQRGVHRKRTLHVERRI